MKMKVATENYFWKQLTLDLREWNVIVYKSRLGGKRNINKPRTMIIVP